MDQNTHVKCPEVFSETGHAYDLYNTVYTTDIEIERNFSSVKNEMLSHRMALKRAAMLGIPIGCLITSVWAIVCIIYRQYICLIGCFWTFLIPVLIAHSIAAHTPKSNDFVQNMESRFYATCIAPLLRQLDSGADVSDKLVYFPIYGYIVCNNQVYDVGLLQFGNWLASIGIIPLFRSRAEVIGVFNTLNVNKEGFFLMNLNTFNDHPNGRYATFMGYVFVVRLHNSIRGWVSLHTKPGHALDDEYTKYEHVDVSGNAQFDSTFSCSARTVEDAQSFFTPSLTNGLLQLKLQNRLKKLGVYVMGDFCIVAVSNGKPFFEFPKTMQPIENMSVEGSWSELMSMLRWIYTVRSILDNR